MFTPERIPSGCFIGCVWMHPMKIRPVWKGYKWTRSTSAARPTHITLWYSKILNLIRLKKDWSNCCSSKCWSICTTLKYLRCQERNAPPCFLSHPRWMTSSSWMLMMRSVILRLETWTSFWDERGGGGDER